jgi:hypothetical protein
VGPGTEAGCVGIDAAWDSTAKDGRGNLSRRSTGEALRPMGEEGRQGRLIIEKDRGDDPTIFDLDRVLLVEGRLVQAFKEFLGAGWEVARAIDQVALDRVSTEIQDGTDIHPRYFRSRALPGREE